MTDFVFSENDVEKMLAGDRDADRIFDRLLSPRHRDISARQWTSAAVTSQVARWLEEKPSSQKIIDIGSGVGKFCILLGMYSRLEVFGLEQRQSLYEISHKIRTANRLERVHFIHGNLLDLSWSDYDIYYLYNPFQEHLIDNGSWSRIDGDIKFLPSLFGNYVAEIFRQLVWAEKGKLLITFHGYGGIVPGTWKLLNQTTIENGDLCIWEKMA